jgi:hypothetical protein
MATTNSPASPTLSRRQVLRGAVASGVVVLTSGASLLSTGSPAQAASQANWRWCSKCEGLWFNGRPGYGRCPAGGGHTSRGSSNYVLASAPAPGQANWRWCSKCEGLWFNGRPGYGRCPAGGGHTSRGSSNYALRTTAGAVNTLRYGLRVGAWGG